MIEFILNEKLIRTDAPVGMPLVDFVRNHERLRGTTVACREGDCGACTLLVGDGKYRSITSCISPLGNAAGKHVVTVDGLCRGALTSVQRALIEGAATQCGFCTPGIVMALTAYLLNAAVPTADGAIAAIDGNICRCTGYKSIERAVRALVDELASVGCTVASLVAAGVVPDYFLEIPARLSQLTVAASKGDVVVGGGSDLFVQRPEALHDAQLTLACQGKRRSPIVVEGGYCIVDANCTVEEFRESAELRPFLPNLDQQLKLFASTQIRQQATLGGNIVNASPIGDMTIFLLALDAELLLLQGGAERRVPLHDFYKGYKQVDLRAGELVKAVRFALPAADSSVHFEKVSKRTHLDIASVNSAIHLRVQGDRIASVCLSAGGVAPFPKQLRQTAEFFRGKPVSAETVKSAVAVGQSEIAPILDVRGSVAYKRLLLRQLIYAHFLTCFPDRITAEQLL